MFDSYYERSPMLGLFMYIFAATVFATLVILVVPLVRPVATEWLWRRRLTRAARSLVWHRIWPGRRGELARWIERFDRQVGDALIDDGDDRDERITAAAMTLAYATNLIAWTRGRSHGRRDWVRRKLAEARGVGPGPAVQADHRPPHQDTGAPVVSAGLVLTRRPGAAGRRSR